MNHKPFSNTKILLCFGVILAALKQVVMPQTCMNKLNSENLNR